MGRLIVSSSYGGNYMDQNECFKEPLLSIGVSIIPCDHATVSLYAIHGFDKYHSICNHVLAEPCEL